MNVLRGFSFRGVTRRHAYLFSLLLVAVAVVVNAFQRPSMLQADTINSDLRIFLPLILVAVGQAVVILGGGIDISVGSVVSIVNTILATQIGVAGDPGIATLWLLAVPFVGMAAGAVNGFFVAILRLQPIITTYATSFLFSGLALFILPRPGGGVPAGVASLYRETPFGLPVPLALYVIGLILLAWYAVRQTRYGRYLYAVGGGAQAAYETGVPVTLVRFSTYVISGLMAALGGIAVTLLASGAGNAGIGDEYTLSSITAVVVGGTALSGGVGGIGGAIVGAVLLGIVSNIISFAQIETWWKTLTEAAVIVAALATPGLIGLIRRRGRAE